MKAEGRPRVRLARTVHGKGLSHLRVSTCSRAPENAKSEEALDVSSHTQAKGNASSWHSYTVLLRGKGDGRKLVFFMREQRSSSKTIKL